MLITDPGSITKLTAVYVTSTSAVLICETKKDVDIDYWEVFVDGELYAPASNYDSEIEITHMYYRLLELTPNAEYTVYVRAIKDGVGTSENSNEVIFQTIM